MIKKIDEKEMHERIMALWLQNVPEENIAQIMEMPVKEVHRSIYMPSYTFIVMPRRDRTGPPKGATGSRTGIGGGRGNHSVRGTGTGKKTGGRKGSC